MTESQEPFWWLLALVGAFIVVFGLGLWVKLSRLEDRNRQAEDHFRDTWRPRDRE